MLGTHLMDVAAGSAMLDALGAMLLVCGAVVSAAVGAVAVTFAVTVRRIRRSRTLTRASLRMHSLTESGPRREVARLRLQLHRTMDGGRVTMDAADARSGLPGETPALFRRLQKEAAAVDQHLRVLQTEDDDATLRVALPPLRWRVDELTRHVRRLRAAVADGLAAASEGSMDELGADVEREVIALKAGRERLRTLSGGATTPPRLTGEGASR